MDDNEMEIFDDDEEVQELRKMDDAYYAMVEKCSNILKQEFSLEETEQGPDIFSFEIFKPVANLVNDIIFYKSDSKSLSLIVALVTYHCPNRDKSESGTGEDDCLYGHITFNKEFPVTFIYKEKFRDRLVDWFVKGDVDFKGHTQFSRSFHLVTKDRDKLNFLLENKPLDKLTSYPDLEIEISGYSCFFRESNDTISTLQTTRFAQLTKLMFQIFS